MPDLFVGSPEPSMVCTPRRKSTPLIAGGGVGPHLMGLGSNFISFSQWAYPKVDGNPISFLASQAPNGNELPLTLANIRYSHVRRLSHRGAVYAVPESLSAYSPQGARRGLFRPWCNDRGCANDSMWLPNPGWYWRGLLSSVVMVGV